ncbi:MAG: acyl-CoA dehydrogenase family protein [Burkholderiaceae bacterium]
MDFDFSLEQKQLKDQVRRYLADHSGREAVRKILDGPEPTDRALWRGLGEMGYLGASIPEAYGGLGAGYLEACVIAEELGRAVAAVPYVSSIAIAAECLLLAGSDDQKQRLLPGLASGETIGTLAWVEHTGRQDKRPVETKARADGGAWRVSGHKLAVADGDVADFAIVSASVDASAPRSFALLVVDLNAAGVKRTPIATIDPTRSHAELTFDDAPAELLGEAAGGARTLEAVFDRAAVLIAFEQIGGADRALEMARDYAMERFAFGRPIGSLQAIKHMLADMYVSATLARSNAYYGAWALSTGAPELPVAAATARVSATQAYQHCARNDIQVHGGMGFTWEFDCHLYYRRSNLLALTIGAQSVWEDRLIRLMREQRDAA